MQLTAVEVEPLEPLEELHLHGGRYLPDQLLVQVAHLVLPVRRLGHRAADQAKLGDVAAAGAGGGAGGALVVHARIKIAQLG